MIQVKKYLGKSVFLWLCFYNCSLSLAQNAIKRTYKAYDTRATSLELTNEHFTLRTNGMSTSGRYYMLDNELHFIDTICNVNSLKVLDSVYTNNGTGNFNVLKVIVAKDIDLQPMITQYKSGNIIYNETLKDSINIEVADSFYIYFIGLNTKSMTYIVNDFRGKTLNLSLYNKFVKALSLGTEISYLLMDKRKINFYYYYNGRKENINLYESPKALKEDYKKRIKYFNQTSYWLN